MLKRRLHSKKFRISILCTIIFSLIALWINSTIHWQLDWLKLRELKFNLITWPHYQAPATVPVTNEKIKIYPIPRNLKTSINRTKAYIEKGYLIRDNPIYSFEKGYAWGKNPNNDRNWQFKLNAWDMLVPFFQSFELTENPTYLKIPKVIIEDWIDYNLINAKPNTFKWYDMATGLRAVQLAALLQHQSLNTSKNSNKELLAKLTFAAIEHIKVLQQPELLNQGNHGLFQLVGLASLCKLLAGIEECISGNKFINTQLPNIINKQFSSEGIHLEHSSQYHPWAIVILENIAKLDLFEPSYFQILPKAKDNAMWFFQPNNQTNLLGDSDRKSVNQYKHLSSKLTYLHSKKGKAPNTNIGFFPKSGFSFFRNHWDKDQLDSASYLAFSASHHSSVHKQRDDLTFSWFDQGEAIITDSGKYSYNSDNFTRFFRSRFAHNTVAIENESVLLYRPTPYGSGIKTAKLTNGIYATTAEIYRDDYDVKHQRALILKPNQWLLVVDKLTSEVDHTYHQLFHFAPSFNIETSSDSTNAISKKLQVRISHLSTVDSKISVDKGEESPNVQGWISEKYLEKQPRTTLSYSGQGDNVLFATLLSFDEAIKPLILDGDNKIKAVILCNEDNDTLQEILFNDNTSKIDIAQPTASSCLLGK